MTGHRELRPAPAPGRGRRPAAPGSSAIRRCVARLVANLCDNAIHYNVPGGVVEVSTRRDTGQAVLVVANTGPVVPPDQVDRLFEPFQRLHRIADDGHHGLGLSIVRAIVAAHAAELTAYARPEGGLVLEIAFPAVEASPEHPPTAATGPRE